MEKVKAVISNNIEDALYGIFDCCNICGDPMETIYGERVAVAVTKKRIGGENDDETSSNT